MSRTNRRLIWKSRLIDEMTRDELIGVVYETADLIKTNEERHKMRLGALDVLADALLEPRPAQDANWEKIYKAALNDLYDDYVEDQESKGNQPAPLQLWIDAAQLRLNKADAP